MENGEHLHFPPSGQLVHVPLRHAEKSRPRPRRPRHPLLPRRRRILVLFQKNQVQRRNPRMVLSLHPAIHERQSVFDAGIEGKRHSGVGRGGIGSGCVCETADGRKRGGGRCSKWQC